MAQIQVATITDVAGTGAPTLTFGTKLKTSGNGSDTLNYYANTISFSPTGAFATPGDSTVTLVASSAAITRVGSLVTVCASFNVNKGTTGAGNLTFSGFPTGVAAQTWVGAVLTDAQTSASAAGNGVVVIMSGASTQVLPRLTGNSSANLAAADIDTGARTLSFSITYRTTDS